LTAVPIGTAAERSQRPPPLTPPQKKELAVRKLFSHRGFADAAKASPDRNYFFWFC